MKTSEDHIREHCNIEYDRNREEVVLSSLAAVCIAVEQAQTETWNEAIKAAAEHAKVKFIHDPDNFQKGGYYVVDQDSILKLKK